MAELHVACLAPRTLTTGTTTYLIPQDSIGLVVGATGSTSLLSISWLLVAKDADGTFSLAENVTETGVPLSAVTANPALIYVWS